MAPFGTARGVISILVEIDLVRKGDWTEKTLPFTLPDYQVTPYRVTISPAHSPNLLYYQVSLRSKLPTIKIPLRAQDAKPLLNLQKLMRRAYVMGRYDHIEYTQPCKPRLEGADGADKEWSEELIASLPKR